MTTWRKLLDERREEVGDDTPIIRFNPEAALDEEFTPSYGGVKGSFFTAWSETHVYFPICYDGMEWVGSAPRNPCDEELEHQGGG